MNHHILDGGIRVNNNVHVYMTGVVNEGGEGREG